MNQRPRLYTAVLRDHIERHRQMAFVSGPRQVGKTTVCRAIADACLNWDNTDDRRRLLRGPAALAEDLQLNRLRDKQKREVDFLIVRDQQPWFLVKVKLTDASLAASLPHFQAQTKAPHAFQVVMNLPYEPADCFAVRHPVVVPARTFLAQLP